MGIMVVLMQNGTVPNTKRETKVESDSTDKV